MFTIVQLNCCYHSPHTVINGWTVNTNLPSNTAFRGFGAPQAQFVTEAILDHIGSYMNIASEKVYTHAYKITFIVMTLTLACCAFYHKHFQYKLPIQETRINCQMAVSLILAYSWLRAGNRGSVSDFPQKKYAFSGFPWLFF